MMILFWLWLLTPAQSQTALERLCFASAVEAQKAVPIVSTVLVKGVDSVELEADCLNIHVAPARGEVFQRWIKARLPHAQLAFSTLSAPKKECDMLAERVTTKVSNGQNALVNSQGINLQDGQSKGSEVQQHVLKVTSGSPGSISMDGTEFTVICTELSEGSYRLKFSHKYTPRTTPTIVNGQLVQIPESGAHPPSASSEIEVSRGQRVDIGSIKKDLRDKDKSVGIPTGLDYQQTDGAITTQWFLTVR
jgi:hypothetical protein